MNDEYYEIVKKILLLVSDFREKSVDWENPTKLYVGNEEFRALLECANFHRAEYLADKKTFMGMRVYHVHEKNHLAVV